MNQRIDRQRGWVGMLVILIALAIVAWLSKDALLKYGMLAGGGATTTTTVKGGAATPGERTGSAAAGAVERMDPTGSVPAPTNAIERARGVEGMVKGAAEAAATKMP